MKIVIGYLYGDLMNIYGDTGNIIALKKRAEWRGIEVIIKMFTIGNEMNKSAADLYFFGGGQDQQQNLVARDLAQSGKGKIIKAEIERGIPLLAICGGYQLMGDYYKPHNDPRRRRGSPKAAKLPGAGLFPAYTVAGFDRMIGNIVVESMFGKLVGFENHSGKTFLKKGALPAGLVIKGFGNGGTIQTEGCIYKNAIGTYMHGSLLPKNPKLADWLLKKALEVKYGSPRSRFGEAGRKIELKPLDDTLENQAHYSAIRRFG